MTVLITGGAGFIGSSLALELIEQGYSIRVLDNLSEQIHGQDPKQSATFGKIKDRVEVMVGDVRNANDWKKALTGVTCVVHLAAETGTGQSMYNTHHYFDVNVSGTAHLIDALRTDGNQVERLVIASSRAIYGEGKYEDSKGNTVYPTGRSETDLNKGIFNPVKDGIELKEVATTEDTPFKPTSVYGLTKQVQEQMVIMAAETMGISGIALRYQNVYGPGQSLINPYTGIISIFSKLLLAGKPINIFEDGEESRDFIYIDDVVKATALAVAHADSSLVASLNVGYGRAVSVKEVAQTLKDLYNSNSELNVSGNYRLGDIRHNFADCNKAKNILGFEPTVDIKTGLKHFSEWVMSQKLVDDNAYEKSLEELKEKGLFK